MFSVLSPSGVALSSEALSIDALSIFVFLPPLLPSEIECSDWSCDRRVPRVLRVPRVEVFGVGLSSAIAAAAAIGVAAVVGVCGGVGVVEVGDSGWGSVARVCL